MYSLHFYGQMLADRVRMDAYAAALRQTVKPDSIVLDLGCGPGLFALLACKLGARRVYAVEPDNAINIAREAAVTNGCADRIEFFQSLSTEIKLPEPATIIISDLRGVLPWFQQHIPAIVDARDRLLAPGAVMIPRRDTLWAALVEAPEQYDQIVKPWKSCLGDVVVDLSAGLSRVTNLWRKTRIKHEELISAPVCWTTLDYYNVNSPDISAEISWRVLQSGITHGVAVWFDTELGEGIGFSNRPGETELIYGTGFFPFSRPVPIKEGEVISLKLRADFVKDDYVWTWDTDFREQKIEFRQSTFYGVALSPERLRKNYA